MTSRTNQLERPLSALDVIFSRRSVRAYSGERLDHDTVRALLDAAVQAPTAMHAEPWAFVVVQDAGTLKRYSDVAKSLWSTGPSQHRDLHAVGEAAVRSQFGQAMADPDFNIFYNAGTLILVCAKATGPFVTADCWLAAANLMLAASAMGLGSCCIGSALGALNTSGLKHELNIPDGMVVVAPSSSVCRPSGGGASPARTRRSSSGNDADVVAKGRVVMGWSLSWQTDTQLHDSVQRQLEWDPEIESDNIAVIASDGVITLTGSTHSYAAKLAAEQSVKRVRGVRGVANEIQVAPLDERTDTEIAKDAVHALRADARVPLSVTVTAHRGILTLEGEVRWMFQKAAAGAAIAHLAGVRGVSNQLAVTPERVCRSGQDRHRRRASSLRRRRRTARRRVSRRADRDALRSGLVLSREARGRACGVGRTGNLTRRESDCGGRAARDAGRCRESGDALSAESHRGWRLPPIGTQGAYEARGRRNPATWRWRSTELAMVRTRAWTKALAVTSLAAFLGALPLSAQSTAKKRTPPAPSSGTAQKRIHRRLAARRCRVRRRQSLVHPERLIAHGRLCRPRTIPMSIPSPRSSASTSSTAFRSVSIHIAAMATLRIRIDSSSHRPGA